MDQERKVIALFADHAKAQAAIRTLQRWGLDKNKLSIVARGLQTQEQVVGYVTNGDRVRYWAEFGALWGGLWGLLLGSVILLFPGAGHVVVLGPLALTLLNAAGGSLLGAGVGALGGALATIGLAPDAVIKYLRAIRAGQFAVMAQGDASELETAKRLLQTCAPQQLDVHDPTAAPRRLAPWRGDPGAGLGDQ